MGSSICTILVEIGEIGRLSASMKTFPFMPLPFLLVDSSLQNEQYRSKLQKSNERSLALVKSAIDIVVAVGLLQLAPKKVTLRVTGAFGFASSVISCYLHVEDHHLYSLNYMHWKALKIWYGIPGSNTFEQNEFADSKLNGEYSVEALGLVFNLALSCTVPKQQGPSMEQVVAALEKVLQISKK